MKRVNVHLTEKQLQFLAETKKEKGIAWAELLRRLLDEHIAEQEEKGSKGEATEPAAPP